MSEQTPYDDESVLAAEYALGLLEGPEAQLAQARMAEDPDFADLVRAWEAELAGIAEEVTPVDPPPRVLTALQRDIFGHQDRPWWQKIGLIPSVVGAAAAAVLVLIAVEFGMVDTGAPPVADYRADLASEDSDLVVAAAYLEDTGELLVDRRAGAARPDRALEVWLIPEGAAPISLGVLPEDRQAALSVPEAVRPRLAEGAGLAISDEPPGGSPTGAPTGDVLAVGPITAL
ncbi:anti-sigma factor domain-containing protein [Roseovarius sp. SYSU LYC5161]|uniref:anti-sigma factor n=1 Tax=Roseovarius halophilus (ex Wu et al. 2025) TaxID=3376060 RepID=UPI00399AF976